ncbi:MAG: GAF domain-containing protein [Limnothrix sp. RL_2_0]|nr:GAF domain-containing protein [Limnothrix sp. RL_2_0]
MAQSASQTHIEEQDASCLLLLRFYLAALIELSVEREETASQKLEKRQITAKYQEAVQQYHSLKEQYDHQYSQQYQQYFSLPIPCYNWQLIDETLQLVDFNPAAARFCHESLGQDGVNIGQTPEKTFSGLPALYRYLYKCYQLEASASHRLQFAHFDLYLRVEYVFMAPDQALVFIIDESEQVLTELKLRRKVRQQSAIAKLGQIGLGSDNLGKFLSQAVVFVARTLNVSYCSLFSVQPNVPSCLLRAGYGWPVDLVGAVTVSTQEAQSHVGYTLAQRAAVVVEDLRLETRFKGEALLHNYRVISGLSTLIGMPDQPWGVLAVYTLETRSFADDEMHFYRRSPTSSTAS